MAATAIYTKDGIHGPGGQHRVPRSSVHGGGSGRRKRAGSGERGSETLRDDAEFEQEGWQSSNALR